ncbi:hypothetical protein [Bacillus cereus]|uniref:Uncharacterized protein n=1 Tax=Bacillus cereus (strain VD146) TaxID=1053236 RepID=R8MDZ9_BACCX|nr:hypothetical protein [Bacillus cereus]EOP32274.1 hypothetical protein IK1_05810 [Bacillus cereus VD146]
MGYVTHAFKKYEIVDLGWGSYEFKMSDYENGDYIYPSIVLEIEMFLRETLEIEDFELVPIFFEIDLEELSEIEIKSVTERLVEPKQCLDFVRKHDLVEKIKEFKPEALFTFEHLIRRWKNGFFVIETY